MRRTWTLAAVAVVLTATVGGAQFNPNGWVFQSNNFSVTSPALATVDPAGVITTLVPSTNWPASSMGTGVTMDIDNKTYVVSLLTKGLNASLLLVDQAGNIVNTITVLPTAPGSGGDFVYDVVMDQNGDYLALIAPGGGSGKGLVKVTRSGFVATSIFAGGPLVSPTGLVVDVETGDYIVLDSTTSAPRLWRINPSGTSYATLATLPSQSYGWELTQLAATGSYYVAGLSFSSRPGAGVLTVTQGGKVTTFIGSTGSPTVYGIEAGRSSPVFPRIAISRTAPQPGIFLVDALTQATTTLVSMPGAQMYAVAQNRGRHVATQKLSSNQWAVAMSFPSEPGNAYLAVMSLSGTRPGFRLPDHRHVSLNVDKLTEVSLNGALVSIFRNNIGTLNTRGEAQAILDLSKLPPLAGIRIWIQVLTQNRQAPNGIQTVADPITLLL